MPSFEEEKDWAEEDPETQQDFNDFERWLNDVGAEPLPAVPAEDSALVPQEPLPPSGEAPAQVTAPSDVQPNPPSKACPKCGKTTSCTLLVILNMYDLFVLGV